MPLRECSQRERGEEGGPYRCSPFKVSQIPTEYTMVDVQIQIRHHCHWMKMTRALVEVEVALVPRLGGEAQLR
jgi:hypothetical protein